MTAIAESFSRQRRSLMATSLVLVAYIATGVRFEKASLFGNEFAITRPQLIPLALWIAWTYFALRYYQLYRDLADPEPRMAHVRYLDQIAIQRARVLAPETLGASFLENVDPATVRWSFDDEVVENRGAPRWSVSLSATARAGDSRTFRMSRFRQPVEMGGRGDQASAWLQVALHTRYFTEYGLPAAIAAAPVMAWLAVRYWLP